MQSTSAKDAPIGAVNSGTRSVAQKFSLLGRCICHKFMSPGPCQTFDA